LEPEPRPAALADLLAASRSAVGGSDCLALPSPGVDLIEIALAAARLQIGIGAND
jgi:hypothetical protein